MSEHRYEGTWKIPNIDNEQEGILFIDKNRGLIRLKLFVMGDDGIGFGHRIKTICPIITGNLIGNNKITLVNNDVIHRYEYLGSYTEIIIESKWAFWGFHYESKDDIKFSKYSVEMDGLLNWSKLCSFTSTNFQDYNWESKGKIELTINETLSIAFIPICKGGKGSAVIEKKLELEQYIKIVFSYNTETSLEEFMLDYKKIEMLITIGSGIIPYRRKTCFYDKRNYFHPERKDIVMPNEIYVGDKPYSKGDEITNFDMLFTLDDIVTNSEVIQNWSMIIDKIKPALNLYFSIIRYEDLPIEMQYLNIVQALETYHARFKYNDLKKYKKHVIKLFEVEDLDDIDEKNRNAYFDTTQSDENISYIILKSRLVDLMNDDFRLSLFPLFIGGIQVELYDFIEKLVDTRHYYTHYGKTKEEKSLRGIDLQYAIAVLMEVFDYHFLVELGLRNSRAIGNVMKRHEKLNYWYSQRSESQNS